jgi:hypothetical protein
MIVVPDAGPLIYLAGAGQLELLHRIYSEVVVPRIVYEEVTIAGAGLVGAIEVRAAEWLRVVDQEADPSLIERLDRGEAAAIPLAVRLGAILLADDGEARELAHELGLVVVGTLGVLLVAKRRGLLKAVSPILERMVGLGMFVAPALRDRILKLAGESSVSER